MGNPPAMQKTQETTGSIPESGRSPQLSPVFLSGESHEWRSLVGYSSWGHKESDMTEDTEHIAHTRYELLNI